MRSYMVSKTPATSRHWAFMVLACVAFWLMASAPTARSAALPQVSLADATQQIQPGDLVFIRIDVLPFRRVAEATGSWTNHVGIVVDNDGQKVTIAESTFPKSRLTTLERFAHRSEAGRVAVLRLRTPPTPAQLQDMRAAAERRLGIHYDTGFDLYSRGQFCSRFVHEVLQESMGIQLGEVTDFATLLQRQPGAKLGFWKMWYLGSIPWQRRTVTPASELNSPLLHPVLDAYLEA